MSNSPISAPDANPQQRLEQYIENIVSQHSKYEQHFQHGDRVSMCSAIQDLANWPALSQPVNERDRLTIEDFIEGKGFFYDIGSFQLGTEPKGSIEEKKKVVLFSMITQGLLASLKELHNVLNNGDDREAQNIKNICEKYSYMITNIQNFYYTIGRRFGERFVMLINQWGSLDLELIKISNDDGNSEKKAVRSRFQNAYNQVLILNNAQNNGWELPKDAFPNENTQSELKEVLE